MPAFITFGRVLFAVLFIVSGAFKLLDIAATTQMITDKVVIPGLLTPYTTQLEGMSGMPMPQMLAIATGVLEVICGLMIALNFGARFFAIVLIFFVIAATFYGHDFWNQTGAEQKNNIAHALKNLSIIGGLFIIAGIGRGPRANEPTYTDVLGQTRRHGVTMTSCAASRICGSPASRPCAARMACGERSGTPGKQGWPPGSRTCGACDSQNVS